VKIIPEQSTTNGTIQGHYRKSNIQMAITLSGLLNSVDCAQIWHKEFHHITSDALQMFKVTGQGHSVK